MTVSKEPAMDDALLEDLLQPVLEQLGKDDLTIPLLPHVANQVLMLTNNPDAEVSKLAALIEQDQALASQILRIANSPACGARYPIQSIHQAISWVGLGTLSGTVFSLSVQSGVFNVHRYAKEVQELWAHAAATGLYAKNIARTIGQDPDTAFLCGLLHSIGKPFVVHTVNQFRGKSEEQVPWSGMEMVLKESYVEMGRKLSDVWQLPGPVKEAIVLHEDCAYHLGTSPTMGTIITNLAIHLASGLLGYSTDDRDALQDLPVVKDLKISESDLDGLLGMQDPIRSSIEPMLS